MIISMYFSINDAVNGVVGFAIPQTKIACNYNSHCLVSTVTE